MKPRPYQVAAATAWVEELARNPLARGIVALPTGGGKTRLAQMIVEESGARTLWLAHTDELVDQPEQLFRKVCPKLDVGVVKAKRDEVGARDVVIASVQTLGRSARLQRLLAAGDFGMVVDDEAHHSAAKDRRKILDAVAVRAPVLGLTATPERLDGKPLGAVFPAGLIYQLSIEAAVRAGWLVPPSDGRTPWKARRIVLPDFHPDKLRKANRADFDDEDLKRALLEAKAVEALVEATAQIVEEGRRPIVFAGVEVELATRVAEGLNARKVPAAIVSGETSTAERRRLISAHRGGRIRALVNCQVLVEGYDDPALDAIVMGRPTLSRGWYIQAVGRGLRTYCTCGRALNGEPCSCAKKDCLVADLVGAHDAHGLCTADILQSYDPFREQAEKPGLKRERSPEMTLALGQGDSSVARLWSFLAKLGGDGLEAETTDLAVRWLGVMNGECYALAAGEAGTILLERDSDLDIWQTILEPRDKDAAPTLLGAEASLELAQVLGENEARRRGAFRLSNQEAKWRDGAPSPEQVSALKRWHVHVPEEAELSRGKASDLLTIAGARARYRTRRKRPAVPSLAKAVNLW